MDSGLEEELRAIVRALSVIRLPASPEEYDIHALVGDALARAGLQARHEVRLGPGCRIDFMCGGVGIEVKKGRVAPAAMRRQASRYAASPGVNALILVAPGELRVPREIGGVPVRCLALGRLWGVALP